MNRLQFVAVCSMVFTFAGCQGAIEGTLPPDQQPPVEPPPVVVVPPVEPPIPPGEAPPAKLQLMIAPITPMVSVGQAFEIEVQVHNVGDGTASGVAPATPFQTGLGHAMLVSPPSPGIADLGPQQMRVFRFGYVATDPGGINFEVDAAGTDIANDLAVTTPKQSAQVVVEAAAALAIDKIELPAQTNINGQVVVRVTVSNPGQATAQQVRPTLTASAAISIVAGPTPAQAELTGGTSASFEWTVKATGAGAVIFTAVANGLDAHSQLPVTASGQSMPLQVDAPAGLEVMASLPQSVSNGQTFVATVVVTNTGTAVAKAVAPSGAPVIAAASGTATATISVAPAGSQDIPGGASATYLWTLTAGGAGSLTFRASFGGTDANSNAVLPVASATSNPLQVLAPTALVVTQVAGPAVLGRGQPFTVSVTVRNNGGTGATGVVPSPSPLTATATGGAQATLTQGPAPQDLAAGAQATYSFSYVETGSAPGTLAFSAGAQGVSAGTGANVTAPAVQSPLLQVVAAPALLTETVVVPARVSRGQTFELTVQVFNSGGVSIAGVQPVATFSSSGGAAATAGAAPAAVTLAAGARATFKLPFVAGATSSGSLIASVVSSGTNPLNQVTITAPNKLSTPIAVQSAAQLQVTSFTLPAAVDRGTSFTLSMRVTNTGEATAVGVTPVPSPPMAVVTGGVTVATTTTAAPVTILGGQTQTFTWIFTETGGAAGTLAFNGGASGKDGNSLLDLQLAALTSNSASVATAVGCNGAILYTGVGGTALDGDRLDLAPNTDRLRLKPYAELPTEFQRVISTTPSRILNQAPTFDAPVARWAREQQLSGVSLYQTYLAAFQGCLTFTAAPTQYSANPTATTATTECAILQRRFWSAIPTAGETQTCATFATSTVNNDTNPRRRWAYVCASVLASAQFLAD